MGNMKHKLGAMLLTLPVTAGGMALLPERLSASANSAPAYWSGTDGSGVVAVYDGGSCPVEVRSETLTFRIPDLPLDGEGYQSDVTAEYVLFNPTQEDVSLTLFFPVGFRPDYYDSDANGGVQFPGAEAFAVTVASQNVQREADISFRYTYSGSRSFDFGDAGVLAALPSDEYLETAFYRRDMRVTGYTYRLKAPSEGDYYTFCFMYDCNPLKTRVICASGVTGTTPDGRGIAYAYLRAGEEREVSFYAVGQQPELSDIRTKLCVGRGNTAETVENFSQAKASESSLRFEDFVENARSAFVSEYGGVSRMDWYNAVVSMLADGESGMLFLDEGRPLLDYLMLWCEYSLDIPARGTLVNAVTAPLYPGIEGPRPDYTYEYLLSPALYWADFGDITIRVETPYHLSGSSLSFTQEDGGYVFTKDSLPMCDLSFTISKSAGTAMVYDPYDVVSPPFVTALVLLGAVIFIAAAVIAAVLLVQRRSRRQLTEQLSRGRAQVGRLPGGGHDRNEP